MSNSSTPSKLSAWFLAMRPKTLPAAVAPIAVAASIAISHATSPRYDLIALAFLCSLSLQILVNFANDYFDAKSGVDTDDRVGPQRATQSGLISSRAMSRAIWLTAALSLATGLPLMLAGGWPYLILGLFCILAALAYSGGPYPLASHGLGEITVFIFFGLVAVVGGSYLFAAEILNIAFWQAGIVGMPISAIMLVNNTRDITTDQAAGKNTLAVKLGRRGSEQAFSVMVYSPAIIALIGFWLQQVHLSWLIAGALTTVPAYFLIRQFNQAERQSFNLVLAQTAKFSLFNALVFAIAIMAV